MTVADKMNTMRILTYAIGIACMIMVVKDIATKGFLNSINLNYMIFLFFGLNCLLYKTPKRMMDAYKPNMVLCCEIATIYFLYSSLASLMAGSGISEIITTWTIAHSDAQTLPVFVYWCASFINLFVPSQGGQWIIQGPIVIEAAQQLGAHVPTVINAFVYGDQGTNMLQPLYAIPLLSVAGMKLKDCWGMMAFIWIFWLILTSLGLYFGPLLLN